jgi:protein-arginine kinase activator protein McsA
VEIVVLTFREVADELGISIGSCHQIFTEKLQMFFESVQNSCSHVAPHPQLSGKTSDIRCAPSTLFPKPL